MDPNKQNNAAAVLSEINQLLARAAFLALHYESLTGVQILVPASVSGNAEAPSSIVYGQNGLSAPREDGAVRSRAWLAGAQFGAGKRP